MGGKSPFSGKEENMDRWISCIKYMVFCLNIVGFIVGAAMFALCIWMRKDVGLEEWVTRLDLYEVYYGMYILLVSAILIVLTSFLGCCAALTENQSLLQVFGGTQVVSWLFGMVGSAVLLDYSTYESHVQPLIRTVFHRMIMNSQYDDVSRVLNQMQETISCCGADGPQDYIALRKPLPTECRDTVTGNAFFYGCVEELTWFLEERSAWLAGIALTLCLLNVINAVLSMLLVHALRKEEQRL